MPAVLLARILCVLVTATALTAQSPLTTTFATNNSTAQGGMMFFDLDVTEPAGVHILSMHILTSASNGSITFWTTPMTWMGNAANAAAWTNRDSGAFSTSAGPGQPTQICFNNGFFLPQGQYGVAIAASLSTNLMFTVGTAPIPLTYATNELTLTAGAASNVPFSGAPFFPRIINTSIYYNVGPTPGVCVPLATAEPYGLGCNRAFASFYEELTTASFDLSNTDITGTNTGSGYSVQVSPGTGILPVGSIGAATTLTMGDDNQVATGTLGMVVGSNGWVARGGGNSNSFVPVAATMLTNPSESVYAWTDLQPNTSGTVTYEEDPVTGATRTTFDAVNGWNTTDPHYIQIDFHTGTGDWVIRFGTVGFANPVGWLVGYSPAGQSEDPDGVDISAAAPFSTAPADLLPLETSSNTPRLGNTWNITTTNIETISPIVLTFFGDRGPPIPMPAVGFNAPGCDINLASIFGNDSAGNSAGSATTTAAIPNNPAFAGYQLAAQSICLTLSNGAGLLTSSSVEGTVGL